MRLIDADALLDAISVHLERIEQEFEDAPTIDAVQVVRCKDCKHYDPLDAKKPYDCGESGMCGVNQDDFCSCGERKDNEYNGR